MTMIEFTDAERDAMQSGADDFETRTRRLNAFDDMAFDLMKRAILEGDITPDVSRRVESEIVAALKTLPEALAEMTLYTRLKSASAYTVATSAAVGRGLAIPRTSICTWTAFSARTATVSVRGLIRVFQAAS